MRRLIIGTGFIADVLTSTMRKQGVEVLQSSRSRDRADIQITDGPSLDALLCSEVFPQVVVVGQLTGPSLEWVLERIDGPRWLILSSHQVTSAIGSPQSDLALGREAIALDRGACVLRPTMVYGHNKDQNVSRLIRFLDRYHVAPLPGLGDQQVQPIHVDDLCALVASHARQPTGGLYAVGGPEEVPIAELAWTITQVLGLRCITIAVPPWSVRWASAVAPWIGLRPDQLHRLTESKTADISHCTKTFDWNPAPLGLRLEQACWEIHLSSEVRVTTIVSALIP